MTFKLRIIVENKVPCQRNIWIMIRLIVEIYWVLTAIQLCYVLSIHYTSLYISVRAQVFLTGSQGSLDRLCFLGHSCSASSVEEPSAPWTEEASVWGLFCATYFQLRVAGSSQYNFATSLPSDSSVWGLVSVMYRWVCVESHGLSCEWVWLRHLCPSFVFSQIIWPMWLVSSLVKGR